MNKVFKKGDVVFFKQAKSDPKDNGYVMFQKGYGMALLLGHLPPFVPAPEPKALFQIMGTMGFLCFDDVIEICGVEAGQELINRFEEKYWGKRLTDFSKAAVPSPEAPAKEPSLLILPPNLSK